MRADAENAAKLLLQRIIFFACMPTNYYLILFLEPPRNTPSGSLLYNENSAVLQYADHRVPTVFIIFKYLILYILMVNMIFSRLIIKRLTQWHIACLVSVNP